MAIHKPSANVYQLYYHLPYDSHKCFATDCKVVGGDEVSFPDENVGYAVHVVPDIIKSYWIVHYNREYNEITVGFVLKVSKDSDETQAKSVFAMRVYNFTGDRTIRGNHHVSTLHTLQLVPSEHSHSITLWFKPTDAVFSE